MAIEDGIIESYSGIEDGVIDQTPLRGKSEKTAKFEAAQAAMINNYVRGEPVYAKYKQFANEQDAESQLNSLAAEKSQVDREEINEDFLNNPYGVTGNIRDTAQAVYDAQVNVRKDSLDPDKQYAESLVGEAAFDYKEVEKEAAKAKMYKMISNWEEELGVSDYAKFVGSALTPLMDSIEVYALTGQYFGQEEEINKAINAFQAMSDEEKLATLPSLKEELTSNLGSVEGITLLKEFLNPLGAEESKGYGEVNKIFDALDVAGIGILVKGLAASAKTSYNLAKSAKAVGNDELAAEASIISAIDEDASAATNLSKDTAISNMLPFDVSLADTGYTKGLSTKSIQSLEKYFKESDDMAYGIMYGEGYLKEGIVNTSTRLAKEIETRNRLKAANHEDIQILRKDQNETIFSYKTRDEDGNLVDDTYVMPLTLNDAGYYTQTSTSLIEEVLASPTVYAKGLFRKDVDTAQRLDYLSDKMRNDLVSLVEKAFKDTGYGISKKSKEAYARIDKALLEGDEWKNSDGSRGRVFTPEELEERFGLGETEKVAYYKINRLYNNLFNIRNHEARQQMIAEGKKNIKFSRSDESLIGKPLSNKQAAKESLRRSDTNLVYDALEDKMVPVKNSDEVDRLYDEGYQIIKHDNLYETGQGRTYYTAVKSDAIEELPLTVLFRKEGYVPRAYESTPYFVKEMVEVAYDGNKTQTSEKALAFFSSKVEADTFRSRQIEDYVSTGVEEGGDRAALLKEAESKYQIREDRETEIFSLATGDRSGRGSGGMYTGARADEALLYGLEGEKAQRLNTFESLIRNISNVSRYASVNQWRLGMEQRWINTANSILRSKGRPEIESFEKFSELGESRDEIRFLNKVYDQIRDWQGFATAQERAWQNAVQKMYDKAADKGKKRTQKFVGSLRDKNPVAVARAISFHALLGNFNPAQFFIQAQGFAIAASLGLGKYSLKASKNTLALASMDTAKGADNLSSGLVKLISKTDGNAEAETLHKLWEKTGYGSSVKQTADYGAVSKGYGASAALAKKFFDKGLMFYRPGEMFNRRFSFAIAVERYKEKNKISKLSEITDDALKDIMDDTNNMMLNMTRSNKAAWQKGLASIPTQYMQVTTKFTETMLGANNNFSKAERAKMFTAQLIMYGTAGVPLTSLVSYFGSQILGLTQEDIDNNPTAVKAWNDGAIGAITYALLDADVEVASRASLLRGLTQFTETWFGDESTIQEKALGAFGSVSGRFITEFAHRMRPFTLGGNNSWDWEDPMLLLTMPFLKTVSTFNNLEKAYVMQRMNEVRTRAGRLVVDRDFDFNTELGVALGFQPTAVTEAYDLRKLEEAQKSVYNKTRDYIMREMNSLATTYPNGDIPEDVLVDHNRKISSAAQILTYEEELRLNKEIFRPEKSYRKQQVHRAIDNIKDNTVEDMLNMRSVILGGKVLKLDTESE